MKNQATVVSETLTDNSVAHNVEYSNGEGRVVLIVGCDSEASAESLAAALNASAWVHVDAHETAAY